MNNTRGRLGDSELQDMVFSMKLDGSDNEQGAEYAVWGNKDVIPFSYDNIGATPTFIRDIELVSQQINFVSGKKFFSGACFKCARLATEDRLKRCAGCLLVGYCSKNCQKEDWKQHKIVCKRYPVENGKNVIARQIESIGSGTDPEKYWEIIEEFERDVNLQMNSAVKLGEDHQDPKLLLNYVINIFRDARVCNVCHEARQEMLFNCRCCAVSYCSKAHQIEDKRHCSHECDLLYGCAMANWYLTLHKQLKIPDGLLKEANLNEGLVFEKVSKLDKYSSEKWLETIVNLVNENLAFPLTIHYALNKFKIGEQGKALSEITSLTIHMNTISPMLDPRMWEFFLHQIPNLIELNLTFINGKMCLPNKYNFCLPLACCSDCKKKQRVITYNIQPMHYDEYISSDDYFPPDVIAVFGIERELMEAIINVEDITYNKHAIVISTAFMKEKLEECVKSFHDDLPINVLLPVQRNPVCGFSTWRLDYCVYNLFNYVCSIQRKY